MQWGNVLESCVVFVVYGTIFQQRTSLLKNSASIEKRKNYVSNCWKIMPVTIEESSSDAAVEKSCQCLLNNCACDCWAIVPVTVEHSGQWLLNNCASDRRTFVPVTVEQSCKWLLKNRVSGCWIIVPEIAEQSRQQQLNNTFFWCFCGWISTSKYPRGNVCSKISFRVSSYLPQEVKLCITKFKAKTG